MTPRGEDCGFWNFATLILYLTCSGGLKGLSDLSNPLLGPIIFHPISWILPVITHIVNYHSWPQGNDTRKYYEQIKSPIIFAACIHDTVRPCRRMSKAENEKFKFQMKFKNISPWAWPYRTYPNFVMANIAKAGASAWFIHLLT